VSLSVTPTALPGLLVLEPVVHADRRGTVTETWNVRTFAEAGVTARFVQDNQSRSDAWVLRGLHYQVEHAQGKLVRAVAGEVFDVAVDLRRASPAFGQWVGARLTAANHRQLWVPEGFAHGLLALGEGAEVLYKCTDFYASDDQHALRWDDPELGIDWPLPDGVTPTLSRRDAAALPLSEAPTFP